MAFVIHISISLKLSRGTFYIDIVQKMLIRRPKTAIHRKAICMADP